MNIRNKKNSNNFSLNPREVRKILEENYDFLINEKSSQITGGVGLSRFSYSKYMVL